MLRVHRFKALLAMTVLGLWTVSVAVADHGDSKSATRHQARLTGAAIQGKTPEGSADFRSETAKVRQRLNVEVEHVNLPAQTVLDVTWRTEAPLRQLDTSTLSALGEGELELNSEDGAVVPAVQTGDVVTVMNGSAAIVAGVFN